MGTDASGLEIEIKLAIVSREVAIEKLARLPAILEEAQRFEENEVYDTSSGDFSREERLLRLRIVGDRGLLTWKEKVASDVCAEIHAKVRREIQTAVDSPLAMRAILLAMGLVKVWRYERFRSYFAWGDPVSGATLEITLDETPIGVFLELEGSKRAIDAAAARMGFVEADYGLDDYRTLHRSWLEVRGLPPSDLVFDDAAER